MKECPNCAVDIADDAEICPICKYDFPKKAVFPWKPVALVLLVILLFPVIRGLLRLL